MSAPRSFGRMCTLSAKEESAVAWNWALVPAVASFHACTPPALADSGSGRKSLASSISQPEQRFDPEMDCHTKLQLSVSDPRRPSNRSSSQRPSATPGPVEIPLALRGPIASTPFTKLDNLEF